MRIRTIRNLSLVTFVFSLALAAPAFAGAVSGSAIPSARPHWYKGNLHTHTLVSDGRAFPVEAALLYRDLGYDFLMLSDHNQMNDKAFWVNAKTHKRKLFDPKPDDLYVRAKVTVKGSSAAAWTQPCRTK